MSDFNKDKLLPTKTKQKTDKIDKERLIFDRKISCKKSSKKREDSKGGESSKIHHFMTSDSRPLNKSSDLKAQMLMGRSNSIDTKKRLREKRKKSNELGSCSGKGMNRHIAEQFSQGKGNKHPPMAPEVALSRVLKFPNKV